jgi:hypothetical protein
MGRRQRLADIGQSVPPHEQQTPEALGAFQKAEIEKLVEADMGVVLR